MANQEIQRLKIEIITADPLKTKHNPYELVFQGGKEGELLVEESAGGIHSSSGLTRALIDAQYNGLSLSSTLE